MTNRILYILSYLWQNSDDEHTASLADISDYLEANGITADSRTLRKDIAQLELFGIDIIKSRNVQNRYHIDTRHFEAPEVKLLIDAIQSAKFITPRKSRELIEKLSTFVSPHQSEILCRQMYSDSRTKANNESIYITVDSIQSAIVTQKKIAFLYFDYSPTKERIYRHERQIYTVSPYALLWNNDTYYMVGYHDRKSLIAKFRVDRVDKMVILDEAAVEKSDDFNVASYFTQDFSMLGGTECKVKLLCDNRLMSSIIDRFGEAVHTEVMNPQQFVAEVTVDLSGTFYGWVFASGGKMRILEPEDAVNGFRAALEAYL